MRTSPTSPASHAALLAPPLHVALHVHVVSSDGVDTWFEGEFDGRRWWSPEVADANTWHVVGWSMADDGHHATGTPRVPRSPVAFALDGPRLLPSARSQRR